MKLLLTFLVIILYTFSRETVIARDEILRGVYPERKDEILRSAQNDKRRALNDGENAQPDLFFETPKHNFGKICQGEEVEHLFKYENRGNGKLIIREVKTTCDCTAANTDLTEIEPDSSGEIRVTYTAGNNTDKFEKAVIVISNDPYKPHYMLQISGEVESEVIADPKYIDFGLIPMGESSHKSIKLSKGCVASFEVTGVESDTPLITASYKENGNDEYIIEAALKSGTHASKMQGNIFVLTKGLKQSRIKLPFYGRVHGDVSDTGTEPAFTIVFTGEETGYLEPCGCSEDQLGGIPKRHTLIRDVGAGLNPAPTPIPVSLGDLTEGFGRQSEVKMEITVQALEKMGYLAHNLGEKDIALGPELFDYFHLISRLKILSSNVKFTNHSSNRIHSFLIKHVGAGVPRPYKVGFLGILSPRLAATVPSHGFKIKEPAASLKPLIAVLKDRVDILVLLSHAEMDESIRLAKTFPELDLVISGHDIDDPTEYEPVYIQNSSVVASAGRKGKYAGIYKFYPHKKGLRLSEAKQGKVEFIPVSSNNSDSPEMKELLKRYMEIVKDENLLAYESKIPTPSGGTFVGSKTCGICHKEVYKHWKTTTHATAYETLIKSEHDYDPDCVPCHVTGFQYESGFESIEETPALKGVGCEDCHGPGSDHLNTPLEEYGKTTTDTCAACHIPDHSPKFEFTSYWEEIIHPEESISALGG